MKIDIWIEGLWTPMNLLHPYNILERKTYIPLYNAWSNSFKELQPIFI